MTDAPATGRAPAPVRQGRNALWAVPILLLSTLAFSASNNLAKVAYEQGLDETAVLVVRSLAMFVVASVWAIGGRYPLRYDPGTLIKLWVLGVSFAVINIGFLSAINHISVSLAVLLLYLGPILTGLLAAALGHERLTPIRLGAAVIAFGGLVMALGIGTGDVALIGVLAGLATAFGFAANVVGSARMMERLPQIPVIFHMMVAVFAVALLVMAVDGGGVWPGGAKAAQGWWALAGVSLAFSVAITTFYIGIGHIGGTRGALIMNMEPVLTIAIAVLLLGEVLGEWQYAGAALVIGAVFLVTLEKPAEES